MKKFDLLQFDLEDLRSPVWYGLPSGNYSAEDGVIPISRDEIFYVVMEEGTLFLEMFFYDLCKWRLCVRTEDDLLYIYLKDKDRKKIISELDSMFSGMVRYINFYPLWTLPVYMNAERITAVKCCDVPFNGWMQIYFNKTINSPSLEIWNSRQSDLVRDQLKKLHFTKYI